MKNLRDHYAAAALTGLLAAGSATRLVETACRAYDYADAMLTKRDKGILPASGELPVSKTALQWFADAHAQGVPWAIQAIKEHLRIGKNWVDGYATLRDALSNAFDWWETKAGFDTWEKIYNAL